MEHNIGAMDERLTIVNQDIIEWSKEYQGPKFHALLTDSPYEYGFLNKKWDATGISTDPSTWGALRRHLLPGAFGMTYGGARTWHRIAVAIEDAGLIIHPSIFCWVYATGLHKGKRLDTVIDKEAGVYDEREIIEKSTSTFGYQLSGDRWRKDHYVTRPVTEEALMWWEYRYGIQTLRPAVEPVILFQEPYNGKATESIRKYGAGALHTEAAKYSGKWPTNFVVSHHPLCTKEECYHSCNVSTFGDQADYFLSERWDADEAEHTSVMYGKKSLGTERKMAIDENVSHPTIKPIAMNMWLAKLLLPPAKFAPRRILVPFGGVMSESIAAILAGWEQVVSVEINKDYATAGANRANWWITMSEKYGADVDAIISAVNGEHCAIPEQLKLDI